MMQKSGSKKRKRMSIIGSSVDSTSASPSPASISNLLNMINKMKPSDQQTNQAMLMAAAAMMMNTAPNKQTSTGKERSGGEVLVGASKRKRKNSANSTLSSMSNKTTGSTTTAGSTTSSTRTCEQVGKENAPINGHVTHVIENKRIKAESETDEEEFVEEIDQNETGSLQVTNKIFETYVMLDLLIGFVVPYIGVYD